MEELDPVDDAGFAMDNPPSARQREANHGNLVEDR